MMSEKEKDSQRRLILQADYRMYEKGVMDGLIANGKQLNQLVKKNLLPPTKYMSAEKIEEIRDFLLEHNDFFVNIVLLRKKGDEAYIDAIEGCSKDETEIKAFKKLCSGLDCIIDRKKNWQYCQF